MDFNDKSRYVTYVKFLKENIKLNNENVLLKRKDKVASQLVPEYFQEKHPSFDVLRYNNFSLVLIHL